MLGPFILRVLGFGSSLIAAASAEEHEQIKVQMRFHMNPLFPREIRVELRLQLHHGFIMRLPGSASKCFELRRLGIPNLRLDEWALNMSPNNFTHPSSKPRSSLRRALPVRTAQSRTLAAFTLMPLGICCVVEYQ